MRMISKAELMTRFNIKDEALRETLIACGFDTKLSEYPEDEIERYFAPVRKAISDKSKHFTLAQAKEWATKERAKGARKAAVPDDDGFEEKLDDLEDLASSFQGAVVDLLIERIEDRLPNMFMEAIYRRMALSGDDAFEVFQRRLNGYAKHHLTEGIDNDRRGRIPGLPYTVDVDAEDMDEEDPHVGDEA